MHYTYSREEHIRGRSLYDIQAGEVCFAAGSIGSGQSIVHYVTNAPYTHVLRRGLIGKGDTKNHARGEDILAKAKARKKSLLYGRGGLDSSSVSVPPGQEPCCPPGPRPGGAIRTIH